MGVRLTSDEDVCALFDSVSGFAFGPTFDNSDDAQDFLDYLATYGSDPRSLSDAHMSAHYEAWTQRNRENNPPEPFDMSGATRGVER